MSENEKIRGGAREGAGRKALAVPRNKFILYVTDLEQQAIKNLVATMRNEKSTQKPIIEEQTVIVFDTQISNSEIELNTLKSEHENEINTLNSKHENEVLKLQQEHNNEVALLQADLDCYANELSTLKSDIENYKAETNSLKKIIDCYRDEVKALENPAPSDEPLEQDVDEKVITIATDERIMDLYNSNIGMKKGRNEFIASCLNRNNELTKSGTPWTAENIKKNLQRIRKEMEISSTPS